MEEGLIKKCFVLVCILYVSAETVNAVKDPYRYLVSLGKDVIMSSVAAGSQPSYATDGDFNNLTPRNCSITTTSDNPEMVVDLGEVMFVQILLLVFPLVDVVEREKYNNMRVTFGMENDVSSTANLVLVDNDRLQAYETFWCKIYGRYITLTRLDSAVNITLCQIAAFNLPVDSMGYGKYITANTMQNDFPPSMANDCKFGSSIFKSHDTERPWLTLSLYTEYYIYEVVIVAMTGTEPIDGLMDVDVKTQNGILCGYENIRNGQIKSVYCDAFGRFVVIQKKSYGILAVNEVFVNPETTENVARGKTVSCNFNAENGKKCNRITDNNIGNEMVATEYVNKRIEINLGEIRNVAMVEIVFHTIYIMIVEIRVGTTSFDSATGCAPLMTPHTGRIQYSFCEPRLAGDRVYFDNAYPSPLEIGEIAVFEETRAMIMNKKKDKFLWCEVNRDLYVTCEVKGYPSPHVTWFKDDVFVTNSSNPLIIPVAQRNATGTYKCIAENIHGKDIRLFKVKMSSTVRICLEMKKATRSAGSISKQLQIDHWHSIWDDTSSTYMKISERKPYGGRDGMWLDGTHPTMTDGVVRRTLCVQSGGLDCKNTIDIDIRRCTSHYAYNVHYHVYQYIETSLEKDNDFTANLKPVLANPKYRHALVGFTYYTEDELDNSYECLMICQLETQCKSFNFSPNLKKCELNSVTRNEQPDKLMLNNDFNFYNMKEGTVKAKQEL